VCVVAQRVWFNAKGMTRPTRKRASHAGLTAAPRAAQGAVSAWFYRRFS